MDGIHDLGGLQGFGPVPYARDDPPWHAAWQRRMFALGQLAQRAAHMNTDEFRHAIERVPPDEYLAVGYFGRWLRGLELALAERGLLGSGPLPPLPEEPPRGALREVDPAPRFGVGEPVRVRDLHPAGHTRLPRYVRGRRGTVALVHPAFVLPDTNAHRRGEHAQHVYAVRFAARDLWGAGADARATMHVDLFEDYLEAQP